MQFFDKKQDVIDVQLTSYGKQLLSRGIFKPVYYAFSDDNVIYDAKWVSGTLSQEQQSQVEERIQEKTPRIKTQNRKMGVEKGVFGVNWNDTSKWVGYLDNLMDLFEVDDVSDAWSLLTKVNINPHFAESEKLLENLLGKKSYFNSYNPAWNLLLYNGVITNSSAFYVKNNITLAIPQINCTLTDTVYKMDFGQDAYEVVSQVKNIAKGLNRVETVVGDTEINPVEEGLETDPEALDEYFEEIQMEDGQFFIQKDFLFFSLEEANVDFTNDNFMIEVYEVTTTSNSNNGEEELKKMFFDPKEPKTGTPVGNSVESVFKIEIDEEIDATVACYSIGKDKTLKTQNMYITDVFDCEPFSRDEQSNENPYENLPDADVGDVC